ncbi:MAG TPA: PIG-L domain-containing protein [Erysipelotrichaceae bacterium]|nr:PIG-L domain-containing protein [Erysipelotrichaceae bacterium]
MNVVVVAPHPDDEIIGVGGTMAKHSRNGDSVHVVTVTRGSDKFYDKGVVESGRNQQEYANLILGTEKVHRLDFDSPEIDTLPHWILVKRIQELISSINPDVAYIPHYGDMHIEHRIVSECCMVALRPKEFRDVTIYGYEVPSETGWNVPAQHNEFIPNVYVKIDDEFVLKKKALEAFSSQMNEYPSARSVEAIESLAKYRGSTVGTNMAEAFMLIRMQRS